MQFEKTCLSSSAKATSYCYKKQKRETRRVKKVNEKLRDKQDATNQKMVSIIEVMNTYIVIDTQTTENKSTLFNFFKNYIT